MRSRRTVAELSRFKLACGGSRGYHTRAEEGCIGGTVGSRLRITLACGDYDRTHALADGSVMPEGAEINFIPLEPGEIFWRQLRHEEFDVSELSLSAYLLGLARGENRFVAIPVFPLRLFRHSFIWVNTESAIKEPQDLAGKRIGIPEYHMTAMLFIRGMLKHDYGVSHEDVKWFRTRIERVELNLPPSMHLVDLGGERPLGRLLEQGELDAIAGTRPPRGVEGGGGHIRRLFPDPRAVELDYFRRTGIFPIMHVVAMRRELYERNRWLAESLAKAFELAKQRAYERMRITSNVYSLPWLHLEMEELRQTFNGDPYAYGVESSRATLEAAALYSYEQGLGERQVAIEEMFAPETLDVFAEAQ